MVNSVLAKRGMWWIKKGLYAVQTYISSGLMDDEAMQCIARRTVLKICKMADSEYYCIPLLYFTYFCKNDWLPNEIKLWLIKSFCKFPFIKIFTKYVYIEKYHSNMYWTQGPEFSTIVWQPIHSVSLVIANIIDFTGEVPIPTTTIEISMPKALPGSRRPQFI